MKWTRSKIEAHRAVNSIAIDSGLRAGDSYRVLIYLEQGWISDDETSTVYGSTIQEAGEKLENIMRGEPA